MRSSRKHFRPILRDTDAQASFKGRGGAHASSHRPWETDVLLVGPMCMLLVRVARHDGHLSVCLPV